MAAATLLAASLAFSQGAIAPYPVYETDKTPIKELAERRNKVRDHLADGEIAIIFTNSIRNRNNDVDFEFRGHSDFIYLTGFEEPDAALLLAPDGVTVNGKSVKEILFVNESTPFSVTWLGYRMGSHHAMDLLGVELALSNREFNKVVGDILAKKPAVSLGEDSGGNEGTLRSMKEFVNGQIKDLDLKSGTRIVPFIRDMRAVKSPFEITMMRKVCEISALAHVEAMKAIKPGMREYEISALMTYNFMKEGCEYTGYPSICGSGPNSNILHYNSNRRLMKDGEIYLMDSAGEYHGYSSDITRTYPVNGKFTKEQAAIYQVVLDAQKAGIALCKNGVSVGAVSKAVSDKLAEGMKKLGLIKSDGELRQYYMHGFGHGLGLDVHDPLPSTLVPGAVLTVEPGIYIKEGSPVDKKWWNIGVRIEDDVLVTTGAPDVISDAAPKEIDEVEAMLATPWKGIGLDELLLRLEARDLRNRVAAYLQVGSH